MFNAAGTPSGPSAGAQQRPPSQQTLPAPAAQLYCIVFQGDLKLAPVGLDLRLRAGAPHALQLLPGHPWAAASVGLNGEGDPSVGNAVAVSVAKGEQLPPFEVAVVDAWGNRTAPTPNLEFGVLVESELLKPSSHEFAVGPQGVATVEGLRPMLCTLGEQPSMLRLALQCKAHTHAARAALEAAAPPQPLE
jgi:hypothetical protein